ncbi:MAG: hypothetical protein KC414_03095 [Romboutsia sp.]|nr:hypothetical protein [Romboutsia sp.]
MKRGRGRPPGSTKKSLEPIEPSKKHDLEGKQLLNLNEIELSKVKFPCKIIYCGYAHGICKSIEYKENKQYLLIDATWIDETLRDGKMSIRYDDIDILFNKK